jgi:hypothetical protein
MKITYDQLNEITHVSADAMSREGVEMSSFDRMQLNDYLTNYLVDRDVEIVEEGEE